MSVQRCEPRASMKVVGPGSVMPEATPRTMGDGQPMPLWMREVQSDRRGATRPIWRHEHGWIPGWWIDHYHVAFCAKDPCTATRVTAPDGTNLPRCENDA